VQICCDNSPNLLRIFRLGYLDIAFVYCNAKDAADAASFWTEEIGWVRAPDFAVGPDEPVPLIGCPNVLRVDQIAIEALKQSKRSYQVVFSAIDFGARLAAVAAGLGYMPLTRRLIPPNFAIDRRHAPAARSFKVGIFVRKEFDMKYVPSLVAVWSHYAAGAERFAELPGRALELAHVPEERTPVFRKGRALEFHRVGVELGGRCRAAVGTARRGRA